MSKLRSQVSEFMIAMNQQRIPEVPTVPYESLVRMRAALLVEEVFEFLRAVSDGTDWTAYQHAVDDALAHTEIRVNLEDAIDALADVAYVTEGAFIAFGVDSEPILDEVHASNMTKTNGPRRVDGKVLKPPAWKAPDIVGRLKEQGWKP